jgi:hypothetical protein
VKTVLCGIGVVRRCACQHRGVIRVGAALCALAACTVATAATRPPQSQAQVDGCGTGAPWVYVGDATATTAAPAPQWVSGRARVRPSPTELALDVPGGTLASAASGLLSVRRDAVPFFVWPERGDRVVALGSWVWNCAAQATELDPFRVLWVQRAFSARSATGEAEADLYVAPDATAAGLSAECAHAAKADGALLASCLAEPRELDVAGDYAFTLPAPPRPRGAGPLQVRIVDQGGGGPDPTVTIVGNVAKVTLHLDAGAVVAKQIFLGWSNVPKAALPEHLKVRLRSLVVRSSTGPWSLFFDVGGVWGSWDGRHRQVVDVYVPRRTAWRFSATAAGGLGGAVADRYATPEGGLGLHHGLPAASPPACAPAVNPKGCFQLDYVVTRVG